MFNVRDIDLGVLDSLTQYPSIPTYHKLDSSNGTLTEECVPFAGEVIATEKVDGANARLISLPGNTYIIGSRIELLYGKGDLIANPKLGIVEALRPLADDIYLTFDAITVYYLEVYGGDGQMPNAKQYTGSKRFGHRLFDVQPLDPIRLSMTREQAASWRQHGGQTWLDERDLAKAADRIYADLVPKLFTIDASELPADIAKMHALLDDVLPQTNVALDDAAGGRAEGIVLRTADRSVVAKARFQDYERTLRVRTQKRGWPA